VNNFHRLIVMEKVVAVSGFTLMLNGYQRRLLIRLMGNG